MWVDLWVFGLIPILFAALFLYLVVRTICAALRGLGWLLGLGERRGHDRPPARAHRSGRLATGVRTSSRICPNPRCRRANLALAHYCAQCGRRL